MSIMPYIDRAAAPISLDAAIAYLGNEPEGMATDFVAGQMYVRDRTTLANNFLGDPNAKLTYASPSAKWITNGLGILESGTTLRCDHDPATLDISATSQHSLGVGTNKTFVTAGAVTYVAGQEVRLTASGDITKWMLGKVVSYAAGSLVVTVYATSAAYFATSAWKVIVALGVLIEEQRTNFLLHSCEFNIGWTNNNVVLTENYATAPNGTMTAYRYMPKFVVDPGSAVSTVRIFNGSHSVTAGQVCTQFIYVKPINPISRYPSPPDTTEMDRDLFFWIGADQFGPVYFNMRTMLAQVIPAGVTALVQPYPNGWYRLSATYAAVSTDSSNNAFFGFANRTGQASFDPFPDGTEEVYIWGAQVELGSFPTSYIPTTTAQVTRAADAISIPTSAFPWRDNAMAACIDFYPIYADNSSQNEFVAFSFGLSATNYARAFLQTVGARTGQPSFNVRGSGTVDGASSGNNYMTPPGTRQKWAMSYDATVFRYSTNGITAAAEDTAMNALPSPIRLDLGNPLTGHILAFKQVPRLKTQAELNLDTAA